MEYSLNKKIFPACLEKGLLKLFGSSYGTLGRSCPDAASDGVLAELFPSILIYSSDIAKTKMRAIVFILPLYIFCNHFINETEAISCGIGRPACIVSCQVQNCATGYCGSDKICQCSRCGTGTPKYPSIPGKGNKKPTKKPRTRRATKKPTSRRPHWSLNSWFLG
ncbi:uncharacterized protein LOC136032205 isoform X1 [Artemia franciscana]|uniref:uncharacterized protein LOC136032205 isoform X1 n=1 Tax=Artemia franciscana TaxID=6661 RepID=UPI0032DB912C